LFLMVAKSFIHLFCFKMLWNQPLKWFLWNGPIFKKNAYVLKQHMYDFSMAWKKLPTCLGKFFWCLKEML
jgi:hypothetical protein